MRIALNLIALILLAFQILAYVGMDRKPEYMYHTPGLSDSQSIAQWLGTFVGTNLFGLVGVGLLLFANTGKRRGTSNAEQVEIVREEPLANVPGPQDDEDVVWEELKEWPEGTDGAVEQEKNEQR
jgi:hypothetical protein